MSFDNNYLKKIIKLKSKNGKISDIRHEIMRMAGVSKQMLSYWEHGKTNPPLNIIFSLADYFNIDVKNFIKK